MAILIIEPNIEALNKYKTMLSSLSSEEEIIYTHLPEQAFDYIDAGGISIIVSELDMEIMTAEDIFSSLDIGHPEIVQMIMTEVVDIERILTLKNQSNLFEILLKPFNFNEDLIEPIKRAQVEHQKRLKEIEYINNVNNDIDNYKKEYDALKALRNKRINDYSNIYSSFSGLLEGNIKALKDTYLFEDELSRRLKLFVLDLIREYDSSFIFEGRGLNKNIKRLEELFNNSLTGSTISINNNLESEPYLKVGNDIYFAIYSMALLCKTLLSKYKLFVSIDSKDGIAVTKFVCDINASMLDNKLIYSISDSSIRDIMHALVENLLKQVSIKTIKGYDNNPFIAITMNKL